MNQYITGSFIRSMREKKQLTQSELGQILCVSDKTISKWETGKGYPDISLIEPLSAALGVSVIELMAGDSVTNSNRSVNMKRIRFYVCPVCGNILWSTGEATISCCGITLPALEAEEIFERMPGGEAPKIDLPESVLPETEHLPAIEQIEDEYYVTIDHEMSKTHYISFIAAQKDDAIEIVKLYPEGSCAARFKISRSRKLYFYCNHHGLFSLNLKKCRKLSRIYHT